MKAGSGPADINATIQGTLALAGAGKMGGALLDGWLDMGLDPRRVIVIDPHAAEAALERFAAQGVAVNPPAASIGPVDTLVLAIKPQSLVAAAPGLARFAGPGTLLVSIVAGKTTADLKAAFPAAGAIARAMPNTPAAVRHGITGIFVTAAVSTARRGTLDVLLGAVGAVEWVADEALIDAVTAVSGSGPAYVFYLTECLARAGVKAGLPSAAAERLARATVEGAGALMAAAPDMPPGLLRQNVTSPGGTTAAALAVLMADDRLARAMDEAVEAARHRAQDLAGST